MKKMKNYTGERNKKEKSAMTNESGKHNVKQKRKEEVHKYGLRL